MTPLYTQDMSLFGELKKIIFELSTNTTLVCSTEPNENFVKPGLKVIKLFSCSTQLGMKFILLINVKMPTVVGILTFISRIIDIIAFMI